MHKKQAGAVRFAVISNGTITGNPFVAATYVLSVGLALATLIAQSHSLAAICAIAILFGWSELSGLCGTSHLGTLTPMRALDARGLLWLKAVAAYTGAGIAASGIVGAAVGMLGRFLQISGSVGYYAVVCGAALILAARELGWLKFELPQVRRQTQKKWQFQFGILPAAAMWGAHIGLGFATVVAHGGFFIVVAFAAVLGPAAAALLLITYWLGRTLPLWFGVAFATDASCGHSVAEYVTSSPAAFRHAAAVGLLCASLVSYRLILA